MIVLVVMSEEFVGVTTLALTCFLLLYSFFFFCFLLSLECNLPVIRYAL